MYAVVDLNEAVEKVGPAHNPRVTGGSGNDLGVAAEQAHKLLGQEAHDEGEHQPDKSGGIHADAHHPVDGLHIPLAPVLADEDGGPALNAEHHQLDYEHRDIGQGDPGQRALAHGAHHEGVHQAQRVGDEILEQDGEGQRQQSAVKALLPLE